MFNSWKAILGFLAGLALTLGLLLTPHLVPGGWGYRMGLEWSWPMILAAAAAGLAVLSATLWLAGRMIRGFQSLPAQEDEHQSPAAGMSPRPEKYSDSCSERLRQPPAMAGTPGRDRDPGFTRGALWKKPGVIAAAVMIALVANTLYMFLVEWFGLHSGWRALIAVLGVPVIYGNLGRVLGRTTLKASMLNIFTSALATMGAGFIAAVILRGW